MTLVKIEVDLRDEAKEILSAEFAEVTAIEDKTVRIIKDRWNKREGRFTPMSGPFPRKLLERVIRPKPGFARYYRLFREDSKKEIRNSDAFRDAALICLRFLEEEQQRWEIRCRDLYDDLGEEYV